jgi:hypothetical protein
VFDYDCDPRSYGSSNLLLSNTAANTSVVSIGYATKTSKTLSETGSTAGPDIPTDMTMAGEAEFNNPDGNGVSMRWVLTGSTPADTVFLTSGTGGEWPSDPLTNGSFTAPVGSSVVAVADIDGDGNPDLVMVDANNKVTFWLLKGLIVVAQESGPVLPLGYQIVGVDSLNSNGKLDLLIWNPADGKTEILAMKGASVASTATGPTIPVTEGWQLTGVNVYTGQGNPNWLLWNPATHATQVWIMQDARKVSAIEGPMIPDGWSLLDTK